MMPVRFCLIVVLFFISTECIFSQGSPGGPTCGEALAFCTAEANTPFNNCYVGTTDSNCSTQGESGIDYGCLGSTPFPTWYFLQIEQTGDLDFEIIQNTNILDDGTPTGTQLDVDYAIWGPFPDTNVCGNLGAPIDCSYSSAAVENARISNAQEGEIYVFLVTNFESTQGEIFITQTNAGQSSGTTDCSIVVATLGPNQNVCEGTTVTLDATEPTAVNYQWAVDTGSGYNALPALDGRAMIDVTAAGTYQVTITDSNANTGTDEVVISYFHNPTASSPNDLIQCDEIDNDGFTIFNLESQISTILNSQNPTEFNVDFFTTQEDANQGTNAIPNTSAYSSDTAVIYVRVENAGLADCFDASVEFLLTVLPLPDVVTPPIYELCDTIADGDDTNGQVVFDLSTQNDIILDGQDPAQFEISYHESLNEANLGTNALPALYTSTSQNIFARVESVSSSDCYSIVDIVLQVNELPVITSPVLLEQCDTDTDGFAPFNLTEAQTLISANANNETFLFTEMDGSEIIDPSNYVNLTAVNATVLFTVTNDSGCTRTGQIDLQVATSQIPSNVLYTYNSCDIDNDGTSVFNFFDAIAQFENLFPQDVIVNFYETQDDAEAEINSITSQVDAYTANPIYMDPLTGTQEIWVRIDGDTNNNCVGLGVHVTLTTRPLPLSIIEGRNVCVNNATGNFDEEITIDGTVENPQPNVIYDYEWSLESTVLSTDSILLVNTPGTYELRILAEYPDGESCEYITSAIFTGESAPTFQASVLEESFHSTGLYTIQVSEINGFDPNSLYEFSLDGGPFQNTNTFLNVPPGSHSVYGRLINGNCGVTERVVTIIDYPRFFTPNGDGINDTWNIIGLDDPTSAVEAQIFIFDRKGKLLQRLNSSSIGWDGTFNGELMASNDYWFRIEYIDVANSQAPRTASGHFTLKR